MLVVYIPIHCLNARDQQLVLVKKIGAEIETTTKHITDPMKEMFAPIIKPVAQTLEKIEDMKRIQKMSAPLNGSSQASSSFGFVKTLENTLSSLYPAHPVEKEHTAAKNQIQSHLKLDSAQHDLAKNNKSATKIS